MAKKTAKTDASERRKPLTDREAAILGVPRDASAELIQAAARGLVAQQKSRQQSMKRRLKGGAYADGLGSTTKRPAGLAPDEARRTHEDKSCIQRRT